MGRSDAELVALYDEGVERVVRAIESAVTSGGDWDARLSTGLRAGLELLAAEPALARLLLVDGLGLAGKVRLAREDAITRLAAALRPPVELTGGEPISDEILRLQAHGLVSYLSGRVLAGETERLSDLHEPLLYYLLAPVQP